jgi:sodium-dependent dicarboxylate transporter 2/3/5
LQQRLSRLGRAEIQWLGLLAGPLLALATWALLPDSYLDAQGERIAFGHAGRVTGAITVWMAVWWMTEAIPLYATALLPLALLPATGATSMRAAASPYGHELIFLFMGGFILALSMQRWSLDRRISLGMLRVVGSNPRAVVGAFMAVTALLSMWVSNTATAVMMLPIAIGVIDLAEGDPELSPALLLGIAYAASIGGIGTLIGTPPNLFLASYARTELGIEISFVRWMAIGLPLVAVFVPLTWLLLTRVLHPIRLERLEAADAYAGRTLAELGPVGTGEKATLVVFALTAVAWVTRPLLVDLAVGEARPLAGLSDAGIAILAALALFVIPIDRRRRLFVMDWETAVKLPWGLLLLFGGGLSLAAAIKANGVGELLGNGVSGLGGMPTMLLVVGVVAGMIFLTEITSNTATTATLVPILAGLSGGLRVDPLLLIVPAAIAASCAFMLPVATPPNAVVFGSGRIALPQMARAGLWLNLVGIVLITLLCYAVAMPLLGLAGGG